MAAGSSTNPAVDDANNTSAAASAAVVRIPTSIDEVIIHPLVLLSAADHYHRVARGTRKRVAGVLLGSVYRGKVDATNSFAVPFEEDSRNPAVMYFDHSFLENMLFMFRKVNAKERVVGFYSSGPTIRPNDLRIFDIVSRFASTDTVFCIIDVRPDRVDLPVTAYKVVEEATTSGGGVGGSSNHTSISKGHVQRVFSHVSCLMGAVDAEEVGVEHLLRDINDPTVSSLTSLISAKVSGLFTLAEKLMECQEYLQAAASGSISTIHPEIIDNLQVILNLLPNLNRSDLIHSIMVKTNDMYMAVYLASLIRSVMALHDLINNKIRYGEDAASGAVGSDSIEIIATTTASSTEDSGKEEKKQEESDRNSK